MFNSIKTAIGIKSQKMQPYLVVSTNISTAILKKDNDTVSVQNNGFTTGQTVLFDGNTVQKIPSETETHYI